MPRGEFDLVAALRARARCGEGVRVGIGDDAALLTPPAGAEIVATTDLLVEGRHFVLDEAQPADVGWKALAVSVSDVAAMGARPLWALLSIALRPDQTGAFADGLLDGLLACAESCGVSLVGGDTSSTPGPVFVNVTLLGAVAPGRAVRREGARAGDVLCVTGALGGSRLGRHLRPVPRHDLAARLVQDLDVHAMIDISDGLSGDLGHMLDASGVGARVRAQDVPLHPDAVRAAALSGRSALDHALHDGEDYELCFALAPEDAARMADGLFGTPIARIGDVTADAAYLLVASNDDARPMERRGHDHFRAG